MKVFFVYAGRQGSNLECALALHAIAGELGFESHLILSKDNARAEQVRQLYPDAEFYDFFSPVQQLELRRRLSEGIAFFTMISPKMMPLFLSLRSKKILYFHATYDYSYAPKGMADYALDALQDLAVKNATLALATQYPLAWQLRLRLGAQAEVLPHPPYSPIRKEFFAAEERVALPFKPGSYFLCFGGIGRPSKGTQVLLKAAEGTNLPVVLAGRAEGITVGKNVVHLDRWVSDGELHWLIKNCRCVVLPYLVSSQFSGCLALAFHFRKPVLAPFSAAFEGLVEEGRTGWLFGQGDWNALREKMLQIARGSLRAGSSERAIARKEAEMEARTRERLHDVLERLERE